MPIAWFLCPYQRLTTGAGLRKPIRYCVMADFTDQIRADGGDWREVEILGNRAIAKVRASDATLTTIAGTPTFRRIPTAILDDPLSTLTAGRLFSITATNTNAAVRYLRCANQVIGSTTPGTTTVLLGLAIPGATTGAGFTANFGPMGIAFSTGLTCWLVTGAADTDVAEVAANEIKVIYSYK